MIERATSGGASIVCLPELFTTKYFAQYESAGKIPPEILDTMCSQLGNPTQIELVGKLQQELGLYRI
jgi:predicted amidohydrolase